MQERARDGVVDGTLVGRRRLAADGRDLCRLGAGDVRRRRGGDALEPAEPPPPLIPSSRPRCAAERGSTNDTPMSTSALTTTTIRASSRAAPSITGKSSRSTACVRSAPSPGQAKTVSTMIALPMLWVKIVPPSVSAAVITFGST